MIEPKNIQSQVDIIRNTIFSSKTIQGFEGMVN